MVTRPRYHHQWLPDTLYLEESGFEISTIRKLESLGHIVKERDRYSDLQVIYLSPNRFLNGASDPRKQGLTVGY